MKKINKTKKIINYINEIRKTIFHKCEICESKIKPYNYNQAKIQRNKYIKFIKHRKYICNKCGFKRDIECDT